MNPKKTSKNIQEGPIPGVSKADSISCLPEDLYESLRKKVFLEEKWLSSSSRDVLSGLSENSYQPSDCQQSAPASLNPAVCQKRVVLLVLAGSRAYGRQTEESDVDVRGIFLPSVYEVLLEEQAETLEFKDQEDLLLFSIAKFFRLAAAGNPNVLEWLFVRPEHVLYADPFGQAILQHRSLFLSKRMIDSYLGYASGSWKQLLRMMKQLLQPDSRQWYKMEKHASHIERLLFQLLQALDTATLSTWNPERTVPFLIEMPSSRENNPVYLSETDRPEAENSSLETRVCFNPAYLNRLSILNQKIAEASQTSLLPERADLKKLDQLRFSIMNAYIENTLFE